ncbi:MAG TPA: DUF1569 domain-containing protein [Ignavibacteria bacterium]|nr:DUF1569 domain-containing protein [Ignavibacteria bacterium]
MQDISNKNENTKIIARIEKINADSKPLWGKMDAGEMLFHLQEPIRVSLGELKLKRGLAGFLFGKIALKQVLSDKPFRKGVPTSDGFKPIGKYEIETEKKKLIKLVSSLTENSTLVIGKNPHPFFGVLTPEQWSILTWKHLDHHLKQFGV